jgi:NAD(P)H dehydrogenase (quinone)
VSAVKILVVYYSSTGTVYRLANAVVEGARAAGAETRLRKVRELAPEEAIRANPAWVAHRDATRDVPEATLEDLEWADGYVFGTPTRYGNVASQLKQFLDSTGPLWAQGKLANKVAAAFTAAQNPHGGQESTILALHNVFYHWGAIIVPPGYTDPKVFAAGGNPYGVSWSAANGNPPPSPEVLEAARYLGQRVATVAGWIARGRQA